MSRMSQADERALAFWERWEPSILRHLGRAQRALRHVVEPDVVASEYHYAAWLTVLRCLDRHWTAQHVVNAAAKTGYLRSICRAGRRDHLRPVARGSGPGRQAVDPGRAPARVPLSSVRAVARGDSPYQRAAWGEILRAAAVTGGVQADAVLLALMQGEPEREAARQGQCSVETVRQIRRRAILRALALMG